MSIGHSGRRGGIGHKYRLFCSLQAKKKTYDQWIHMNAVGDDLGSNALVHQGFAKNPGIAMSEGTHRIEYVGGMSNAGGNARFRCF